MSGITPKQNWRYPTERWMSVQDKNNRLGFNASIYLTAMCELLLAETDAETIDRLLTVKGIDALVEAWNASPRRPQVDANHIRQSLQRRQTAPQGIVE